MKNRIYFFTGTGNSLHVAKHLATRLEDAEIIPINQNVSHIIPEGYERIGFVYPTYYWGMPAIVADFIRSANFPEQDQCYYFVISTCGAISGAAVPQARDHLQAQNIKLDFGMSLRMFGNAINFYNMRKGVKRSTQRSNRRIAQIVDMADSKRTNRIPRTSKPLQIVYGAFIKQVHNFDRKLWRSQDCNLCRICQSLCMAGNIDFKDGELDFKHQCQACVACIQHCPQRALNYARVTKNRRRYIHPEIQIKELATYSASRDSIPRPTSLPN